MEPRVPVTTSGEPSEGIDLPTEYDVTDANTSREDALQAPSLHVAPKKENKIGDDNNEFFFPRSEYKVRFKDTSAFAMSDPDYWGTYFRSTSLGGNCDRIAKLVKSDKAYKNSNVNKSCSKNDETIPPSKSGCIRSPWEHSKYKEIFYAKSQTPKKMNKNNGTLLYDQLLQYKTNICDTVVKKFVQLKISDSKIDVYFENDYPCIMVQINKFAELFHNKTQEQGSLYKIVVAYFIAITNSVANRANIPIELVNRESFGHNIPSVSTTGKSFRISIGIVPKSYAEVLAKSLELLDIEFLVPLLNKDTTKTLKLGFSQEEINHHNDEVNWYNEKKCNKTRSSNVGHWKENDSLFDVLCKVGDSSGRKVSYQITRLKKYIDLLADYVLALHNREDFAKPLSEILKKLTYKNKNAVTIDNKNDDYNISQFVFRDKENEDIKNDEKFWGIMQNISSIFEKVGIKNLSDAINSKKITGLYRLFEKANLEFIRNSSGQQSEDGYGSSSDCEVSVDDTRFYSRKMTVPTGIRAINIALFLSIYISGTEKIDTKYMYYETSDVLKTIQDINKLLGDWSEPSGLVQFIDLNHCAANGPNIKIDLEGIRDELNSESVIVLDYTSATTKKISEAIRLFIKKVPVLLLVSSGIKNEQVGADMNPYGTLRIIATDSIELNELWYILKAALIPQEKLPQELHNIRKTYKDAGAVVTSAAIYTEDRGYDYQPKTDENCSNSEYSIVEAGTFIDELKKIVVLFSDEYDEELYNITETHGMSLDSIISWDREKIKFLGSDEIISVINRFDDSEYIFEQITNCYDSDPKLTCDIKDDILNSEEDIDTSFDFEDLAQKYKRILEESDEDSEENIIERIVREQSYDSDIYRAGFGLAKASGWIDSGCSTPTSSSDDRMATDSDTSIASSSHIYARKWRRKHKSFKY